MSERCLLPDGYHTVPPGKLVNAVTWLEMRAPPAANLAEPLPLAPPGPDGHAACRALYRRIAEPWLWDRAFDIEEQDLSRLDIFVARDDAGSAVGIVEFFSRPGPDVEIAFFGLVPEATGQGLGRRMMAAALGIAWAAPAPERVWLHTCHYDHPGALGFYRACGFTPYAMGFEIADDPRLAGLLPRDCARHVPIIDPAR